jgi:hypothetical protein
VATVVEDSRPTLVHAHIAPARTVQRDWDTQAPLANLFLEYGSLTYVLAYYQTGWLGRAKRISTLESRLNAKSCTRCRDRTRIRTNKYGRENMAAAFVPVVNLDFGAVSGPENLYRRIPRIVMLIISMQSCLLRCRLT